MTPPVILSIAGSDPSGGAGIQADIKTISALQGYAAAVITAITVQNTVGVKAVDFLSPNLVSAQIEAVMEDLCPAAIKIGMTGRADIVRAIAGVIANYPDTPVVLDPVMLSTSGHPLTEPEAVDALCTDLFPLCRLVTPNLNEAARLLQRPLHTPEEMEAAAIELSARYGCAFLLKGGHLEGGAMTDILYDRQIYRFTSPRIDTRNLHGTGCTYSSAIATLLGHEFELQEAVRQAKLYMDKAIQAARCWHIGKGQGPLCHFRDLII